MKIKIPQNFFNHNMNMRYSTTSKEKHKDKKMVQSVNKEIKLKLRTGNNKKLNDLLSSMKLRLKSKNILTKSLPHSSQGIKIEISKENDYIKELKERLMLKKLNLKIKKMKLERKQISNKNKINENTLKKKMIEDLTEKINQEKEISNDLNNKINEIKEELENQREILMNYILTLMYNSRQEGIENYPNVDNMTYEELLALEEKIGNVSKGMKKEDINKLALVKFSKNKYSDDKCIICQYEFNEQELVTVLPCKHCFHFDCIKEWLVNQKICPFCKTEIIL